MVGIVLAALASLGWGTSAVLARAGLRELHVASGTLVSLLAGLALTAILAALVEPGAFASLSLASILWFALAGVLSFPMGRLFNYMGLSRVGVSGTSPIVGASPIFATILAISLLGERASIGLVVGTVAIVGGVALVVRSSNREGPARGNALGYGFAVAASIAYGVSQIAARQGIAGVDTPIVGAAVSLLFGTVVMGVLSVRELPSLARARRREVAFLALAGLAASSGVALMYLALSKAPVVVVSPLVGINPLIALLLAHLFLQRLERVSPSTVAGAAVIVTGVVLVAVFRGS